MSIEDIDWSSPADLEPYGKAKQIEENAKDIVLILNKHLQK